jgi:hypothetical protein
VPAPVDDEEPIGGPHDHAAVEVGRHDDESIGHSPVSLGNGRHRVSAVRPSALATKFEDEPDTLAIPGAPRLAHSP